MSVADKTESLLKRVAWSQPALAALRLAADPAGELLARLARQPRGRYQFEYEQKAEILACLRATYGAWRGPYDLQAASKLAKMTIAEAQGPRALSGVAHLGRAWWATGDASWGAAFERFYTSVPTGEMFNWGSFNGTQPAAELDAWFLLQDCPGFSRAGRIAWLDHLLAIADDAWDTHTSRWAFRSLGPEGHNWYLHGIHALPTIGLLFPEFSRAEFLLKTAWSVFEEHLRGHYRADGGARETTIGYQAGSVGVMWQAWLIAQRNGWPMSSQFTERLLRATHFLLRLMTPLGGLPSFGDSGHAPGDVTRIAALAAALTGDGECKWYAETARRYLPGNAQDAAGELPYCAFWSVGLAGYRTYAATRAQAPRHGSVLQGDTGYLALRGDAQGGYLAMAAADRGPIVTSHGHNEILGLEVHGAGVRFLGEMGCAPYGNSPGRDYDQLTEAHNCLGITGLEQSPIQNEWRWGKVVVPAVRRWWSSAELDFCHGVHEGFYDFVAHQVLHARKLVYLKGAAPLWLVFDWLETDREYPVNVWWHGCVPGTVTGESLVLGQAGGPRLHLCPPAGEGAPEPYCSPGLAAYIAEKKLVAEQVPCFVYRRPTGSTCLPWLLSVSAAGTPAPTLHRLPITVNGQPAPAHLATAVEVRHADGARDLVCLAHGEYDAELVCGELRVWGSLAVQRFGPDGRLRFSHLASVADGHTGR